MEKYFVEQILNKNDWNMYTVINLVFYKQANISFKFLNHQTIAIFPIVIFLFTFTAPTNHEGRTDSEFSASLPKLDLMFFL